MYSGNKYYKHIESQECGMASLYSFVYGNDPVLVRFYGANGPKKIAVTGYVRKGHFLGEEMYLGPVPVTEVEPIRDPKSREGITKIIEQYCKERDIPIDNIKFWD